MNIPPQISFGNSCASEFEVEQRLSLGFRVNVYFNNSVIALSMLFTHLAVKKMFENRMFGKCTRNLLFFCMAYYIIHDVYFAGIMNWSFYRSIAEWKNACSIMFKGRECFSFFLLGLFFRVLLLYSQWAVTMERLITTLLPNSDLINSSTANILTVLMAVVTTNFVRPVGPSEFSSSNCIQQLYPGMKTLRKIMWVMVAFDVFCFPVNFFMAVYYRRKLNNFQNQHEYDLRTRYFYKKNTRAAMLLAVISFVQTSIYTIHITGLHAIFYSLPNENDFFISTTIALWFYTIPLAGLALPVSILVSTTGWTIRKKNKVAVMKGMKSETLNQDLYFKGLQESWNTTKVKRT